MRATLGTAAARSACGPPGWVTLATPCAVPRNGRPRCAVRRATQGTLGAHMTPATRIRLLSDASRDARRPTPGTAAARSFTRTWGTYWVTRDTPRAVSS